MIVGVAVPLSILLLAGGGLYFLEEGPPEKVIEKITPAEMPQFLKVESITVSYRRGNGTAAGLTFTVSLDLAGGIGASVEAAKQMPQLRDAFLAALDRPPLRAPQGDDRAPMDEIKSRLLAASRAVLGKDTVRDVLIQSSIGG